MLYNYHQPLTGMEPEHRTYLFCLRIDGVSLKTPRPRGWVGAGRPSGCKSSFNKRNMYQYPHVSQLFILLPWQSRVYPEPLKVVEFVQLTTECCWGQPSDPCQRGCLTSHACVMWGPRTLNADDDDRTAQSEGLPMWTNMPDKNCNIIIIYLGIYKCISLKTLTIIQNS